MSEVTARKRGEKWEYRFEGASVTGKRKQISKSGFRTKKEAMLAGAKAYGEYNRAGMIFEPNTMSVSDYLDHWFENEVMINRKYNTQVAYKQFIRNYFKPAFGHYRLASLSPAILTEWLNSLRAKELSANTLKHLRTTLSVALDYAVEPLQYISSNPMKLVRTPKFGKKQKERVLLDEEQFSRILQRFPCGNRYHIPFLLGWNLGLRISEVFGLTWDDIDFEKCIVSVTKQMIEKNCSYIGYSNQSKRSVYLETLKTDSSVREIKFGSTLKEALIQEKIRQESFEKSYGQYYTAIIMDDHLQLMEIQVKDLHKKDNRVRMICIDENGTLTTVNSMKYPIKIIQTDLKIHIDFHSFRHTHATKLLDNGAEIKAVQTRLGHKNLSTTYDTYIHKTTKMEDKAVDIFESINEKIVH